MAWHPQTLSWVPPDTSPALQAAGCASSAYVHTLYIAVILRYALPLILRLAFSVSFFEITHCFRLSFVCSWPSRPRGASDEDPPVLRSGHVRDVQRACHVRGVPGCSVSFASGRTTVIATDSGDGLSRSVSFPSSVRIRLIVISRSFLLKIIVERANSLTASAEREIAQDVTEKLCCFGVDDTELTTAVIDKEKTLQAPRRKHHHCLRPTLPLRESVPAKLHW